MSSGVYIFRTISSFIKYFDEHSALKECVNTLLLLSFPEYFSTITIFKHLDILVKNSKINNDDVSTFVKIDDNVVLSFAQLVKEQNPQKYRIINLCRLSHKQCKGEGRLMLQFIIDYAKYQTRLTTLYLTVDAMKTTLQMYYSALGWINTYKFDPKCDSPGYEYIYYIRQ